MQQSHLVTSKARSIDRFMHRYLYIESPKKQGNNSNYEFIRLISVQVKLVHIHKLTKITNDAKRFF